MPHVQSRLKENGLALVTKLTDTTGASTSSIVSALLEYLALYHKDEAEDFMLRKVEFYTMGYRFRRRSTQK